MSLSLGLGLGVCELGIRIWKRDIAYQPDPELIRSLRPTAGGLIFNYETDENLNGRASTIPKRPKMVGRRPTNNVGFRMSRDIERKRPHERRVLLLGDSYTEAVEWPEEIRFFYLAEQKLQAAPTFRNWNILNGGIQNGAPSQYILQLRRYLPAFKPDLVVLVVAPNDVSDDGNFTYQYGFRLDGNRLPLRPKNTYELRLLHRSFLARYVSVFMERYTPRLRSWLLPPAEPNTPRTSWVDFLCRTDERSKTLFRTTTGRYLVGARAMVEQSGAQFAVLLIHYLYAFDNEPFYTPRFPDLARQLRDNGCQDSKAQSYNRFMEQFLSEHQVTFLNTYSAFAAAKKNEPKRKLWGFYDYHFSPAGHQIMANELVKLIREAVKPSPGPDNHL